MLTEDRQTCRGQAKKWKRGGGTSIETSRVHHAAWRRRGCGVANRSARAAGRARIGMLLNSDTKDAEAQTNLTAFREALERWAGPKDKTSGLISVGS